jgi:hypothetical protein
MDFRQKERQTMKLYVLIQIIRMTVARKRCRCRKLDVTARHLLSVHERPAKAVVISERTGTIRMYEPQTAPIVFYDLGKAVVREGSELAQLIIGVYFAASSFAVSVDPYPGTVFRAEPLEKALKFF